MKKVAFILGLISIMCFTACNKAKNYNKVLESICAEDLGRHIQILSSDEFEGRAPGTQVEVKTLNYIKNEFEKLGLEPGNGNSYLQEVPLIKSNVEQGVKFQFSSNNESIDLEYGTDFTIYSPHYKSKLKINDAEIVFVGFGIVAPEYNWDDYADIDVEGKIVLALINDPGFYQEDTNLFKGKEMTYYGRNSHKFEEAAKRGAKGIIIIHIDEIAGYKWNTYDVRASKKFFIASNTLSSRCSFEGTISYDKASDIFNMAGLSIEEEIKIALKESYKPKPIELKALVSFKTKKEGIVSHNVIATWKGKRSNEAIVFSAHWDHLGIGKPIDGDSIYNGAADNAVGVSALIEIAEAFTKLSVKPECSVIFLITTAEERGLLGAEYFALNPVIPFENILANFNIDGIFPFGKMKDVGVIGHGLSDLDDVIQMIAEEENRTVSPNDKLSEGYFFRLDMYHFAKNGVPAIHIGTGKKPVDSVKTKMIKQKLGRFYHKPFDEYKPELWDMEGMIDDIRFIFKVAYSVSKNEVAPQWNEGVAFGRNE